MSEHITVCYDPSEEYLQEMMAVAGAVVDPNDEFGDADPSVVAQALELRASGRSSTVVTRDSVTHGAQISLVEACDRFDIPTSGLLTFIASVACGPGSEG